MRKGGRYNNALYAAAAEGHKEIARLLLDKGAGINSQGGDFGNALQAVAYGGNQEIIMLLQRNSTITSTKRSDSGISSKAAKKLCPEPLEEDDIGAQIGHRR